MIELTCIGRKVRVSVTRLARGEWDYSFVINGSDLVWSTNRLAPSRRDAIADARVHAEECIRQLRGGE